MQIETLMWLLPIMYIVHDFEEIIMVKPWAAKNSALAADFLTFSFGVRSAIHRSSGKVYLLISTIATIVTMKYINSGLILDFILPPRNLTKSEKLSYF
jgi:hypothetical protein